MGRKFSFFLPPDRFLFFIFLSLSLSLSVSFFSRARAARDFRPKRETGFRCERPRFETSRSSSTSSSSSSSSSSSCSRCCTLISPSVSSCSSLVFWLPFRASDRRSTPIKKQKTVERNQRRLDETPIQFRPSISNIPIWNKPKADDGFLFHRRSLSRPFQRLGRRLANTQIGARPTLGDNELIDGNRSIEKKQI